MKRIYKNERKETNNHYARTELVNQTNCDNDTATTRILENPASKCTEPLAALLVSRRGKLSEPVQEDKAAVHGFRHD